MIPAHKISPNEPRDEGDEYTLPERIVLDEVAFAELSARIENPAEPTAALRALLSGRLSK